MIDLLLQAFRTSIRRVLHSMENILKRFIAKEQDTISARILCFKQTHKLYWAKKMKDGSVQFWAYSVHTDEKWYLGKYERNQIIECERFYHSALPWDVQRGGKRIFEQREKWQ